MAAIFVYSLTHGEETEHYKIKQPIRKKSPLFGGGGYLGGYRVRFLSPSRSIHFGDVSQANGRETSSLGARDPKRFGSAE